MPKPPPRKPRKPKTLKPPASKDSQPKKQAKTFSVKTWGGEDEGEKIVLYGRSGGGKTTLASMLPDPIFIGLDDGGRKIKNPQTGKPIKAVDGVETFEDVRDALHQGDLFKKGTSVVIDTFSKLEALAEPYLFANIRTDKGHTVTSLEGYGWGKGYKHSLDTMRLVLADLEVLVRKGVHVCLICQESAINVANAEGIDYIQDGPKLHHNKQHSTRFETCEWADHVLRIGHYALNVVAEKDAKVGKVQSSDDTRAIYTTGATHFFAKSRTLSEPIVAFEAPDDDSIWQLLFGE